MDIIVVRTKLTVNGNTKYGTGFYVSKNYILTACHNIELSSNSYVDVGSEIDVSVLFPDGKVIERRVLVVKYYTHEFVDCAILFDPLAVIFPRLTYASPDSSKDIVVIGFSRHSYDERYGVLEGISRCINNTSLYKIRITGVDVKPGMSGSPVIEKSGSNILGYAIQRDKENYREAYFIPLEALRNKDIFSYIDFNPFVRRSINNRISTIAHFMDHYVVKVNAHYSDEQLIKSEMERAFLYLFTVSDVVYVPAVSYFEMPYCRSLISKFKESYPDGKIVLIGDGEDIYSFLDLRMYEYEKGSKQLEIYRKAIKEIPVLPPYKVIESNTTDSLIRHWPSTFVDKTGDPKHIFTVKHLRKGWGKNLELITDHLDGKAFIASNVCKILYSKTKPNNKIAVMSSINEVFFDSFISILRCKYLSELYYLRFGGPTLSKFGVSYTSLSTPFVRNGLYNAWSKEKSYRNYIRLVQHEETKNEISDIRKYLVG